VKMEWLKLTPRCLNLFRGHSNCGSINTSQIKDKDERQQVGNMKRVLKNKFENKCWICGSGANLTIAHIVPRASHIVPCVQDDVTYSWYKDAIGELNDNYDEPFSFSSERNMVVLCGTKDSKNTCHSAFDNHCCSIIYDGTSQLYFVIWFDSVAKPQSLSNDTSICVQLRQVNHKPFRRALWAHSLESLARHDYEVPGDTTGITTTIYDMQSLSKEHSQTVTSSDVTTSQHLHHAKTIYVTYTPKHS
jgi:hypothetical protein